MNANVRADYFKGLLTPEQRGNLSKVRGPGGASPKPNRSGGGGRLNGPLIGIPFLEENEMQNVVKGFQFSQMAVPKATHMGINADFNDFHTPNAPKAPSSRMMRIAPKSPVRIAARPGKNVGIRGGYKV